MKKRCDWPALEDLVPEPLFRFGFLRASWSQRPGKSRLRRAIATAAQHFHKINRWPDRWGEHSKHLPIMYGIVEWQDAAAVIDVRLGAAIFFDL